MTVLTVCFFAASPWHPWNLWAIHSGITLCSFFFFDSNLYINYNISSFCLEFTRRLSHPRLPHLWYVVNGLLPSAGSGAVGLFPIHLSVENSHSYYFPYSLIFSWDPLWESLTKSYFVSSANENKIFLQIVFPYLILVFFLWVWQSCEPNVFSRCLCGSRYHTYKTWYIFHISVDLKEIICLKPYWIKMGSRVHLVW